jgi:phage terminase large subunit-like protein
VLDDCSVRMRPDGWAARVIRAYREHRADKIIAEKNFGGEMVEETIRRAMPSAPIKMVHASRGKHVRAEPISALYEQRKVRHARPFPLLEEQMSLISDDGWQGTGSPDRLDAAIWALTELSEGRRMTFGVFDPANGGYRTLDI